jgi:ABC-type multidrug transport system ATPase subunit
VTTTTTLSVVIEDLWKSYGRLQVLRGITATFAPGRVAALVRPNGAGKTTLMRIVAGLQTADRGSVRSSDVIYYGGFDTLPLKGRVRDLRRALGLSGPIQADARRLSQLSRGELQRVGLEACLELKRPTVFLDEPWTSLEPDVREELNLRLRWKAGENAVVVCSTHDLDEAARVADDLLFLREGHGLWLRREDSAAGAFEREEILRLFRRKEGRP